MKFVQISGTRNNIYGLTEDGLVYMYTTVKWDTKSRGFVDVEPHWVKLAEKRQEA